MSRVQKRAEWMRRRRLEFLLALVVLMALLLGLRAADLQLFHRGSLLQKAVAQREDVLKIPAPRGDILDAQGRVLAASVRVPSIACFAEEVPKEAVGRLARALELEPKRLARRLSARSGFVWLRRQVPPEMARRVQALDVPGVQVIHEWRRYYPLGAAMGPVLGFVDIDGKGIEGIEFVRDRWLAGHPGRKVVVRDAKGRTLQARWLDEPRPGRPLRLT
ncbi:MAG: peptidoglycan glycosyltransferase, partial [Zetaproteobacteria bacterium]